MDDEAVRRSASNVVEALEELNMLNEALPGGEELAAAIDALHLQYRAVRASYAAQSYLNNRRFDYANTLCLFAQQILEELGDGLHAELFAGEEKPFVSLCLREDLASDVEVLASRVKAEALLAGEETPAAREGKFVCDDLGSEVAFNASGKYLVTRLPVPMKCATCKPLFFDLYGDCVSYPDMAKRAEKKSTGGLSWFKRWIWRVCFGEGMCWSGYLRG